MKTVVTLQLLTAFSVCLLFTSPAKAGDDRGKHHEHHEFWNHDLEDHSFRRDHFTNQRKFEIPVGDVTNNRAPIDGGLSLLLAAGIGFGIKRARNRKKQLQSEAHE